MHLNTHFIFSTFHLSITYFYHSLIVLFQEENPGQMNVHRKEALTLNGHVSSAKSLMDDSNYQKLGRLHKGGGSICDVTCSAHSEMLDDDIRLKHGTRRVHCRVGMVVGDGEGEDQECSALLFPMCVGSKRIPNAFIKADNRRGEEQCVLVDTGKRELGRIESCCTGRLTGIFW